MLPSLRLPSGQVNPAMINAGPSQCWRLCQRKPDNCSEELAYKQASSQTQELRVHHTDDAQHPC